MSRITTWCLPLVLALLFSIQLTSVVVLSSTTATTTTGVKSENYYQEAFLQWAKKYNKTQYLSTDANDSQFMARYNIFKSNLQYIESHNENPSSTYLMEPNFSADMTWEEFEDMYKLKAVNAHAPQYCSATNGRSSPLLKKVSSLHLPTSVDWRKKGIVTPVKNQRNCGSCWTFSSTGAIEGYYAQKTGNLVSLSEQQLVDCAGPENHGCAGGLPSSAFTFLSENGGIQSEISYPYEGIDNKCRFDEKYVVTKLAGSVNITQGDEQEIERTVATLGVVSIAYQVVQDFRFYKSGVYTSTKCKSGPMDVNHAVLVVGYDVDPQAGPYWIIKNSWGLNFGIQGYFWMARYVFFCFSVTQFVAGYTLFAHLNLTEERTCVALLHAPPILNLLKSIYTIALCIFYCSKL